MPLAVPPPLAEHRPPGFPWLGALAPVGAAALLFAVTSSPFALVFAVLGPVTAVAALLDGARQARAARRRDEAKRRIALDALSEAVDRELSDRARAAEATLPGARALLAMPRPRACIDTGATRRVRVGRADLDSGIHLEAAEPEDVELVARAAVLPGAPLILDAAGGIGVVGPSAIRTAVAETLHAQLRWRAGDRGSVPHVVSAERVEQLPQHCEVLLRVDGPAHAEVIRAPSAHELREFRPEVLSALERRVLDASGTAASVPDSVDLVDLLSISGTSGLAGLGAVFTVGADGPVEIDLVRDGPHALVGGTTGSGKSELLVSWILALTAGRTARELGLLLFDFKGGSAFDSLVGLPHVRGLVTDLDAGMLDRAAAALGAELRSREARLRERGARSAEEMPDLGRLVIVVDEFAALLGERRELHDVFVDVAARGRSLGVHLVLCTQRPAGVVRDSLAANCALRISLRVVDAADSAAVVGDASAAEIPRGLPGRCVVALHGETPKEVQVGVVARDLLARVVAERSAEAGERPAASVWLPPLPRRIDLEAVPAATDGARLGLLDLPDELSQPAAVWEPAVDGALAVIGAAGAGRTTAARTLAHELRARLITPADPHDPDGDSATERLWDALTGRDTAPLVVDDADTLLDRMDQDQRAICLEALAGVVLRRERRVAMTMTSPLTPTARALTSALASRLVLRTASADEHRIYVDSRLAFDPRLPPGGGVWRAARVQVAVSPRASGSVVVPTPAVYRAAPGQLVVTTAVDERLRELRTAGFDPVDARDASATPGGDAGSILVIDPAGWQSAVGLWSSLGRVDTVYDRCSVADYRAVSRERVVPPVLDGPDRVWLVRAGRGPVRARWQP